MAATAVVPFVSVEEYLHSDPQPDVDYVDGVLEERNLGEVDHADLESELITIFRVNRDRWNIKSFTEARVQVSPTRYRIPDVCVMPPTWERTKIVRDAPLLCVEVKSEGFTLNRSARGRRTTSTWVCARSGYSTPRSARPIFCVATR